MDIAIEMRQSCGIIKAGDDFMPLISSFFGILIYMFKEKNSPHSKPHVHAVFAGDKMSIAADGEILAGKLPRKQQKYVEA
jgi:hypothetical protein